MRFAALLLIANFAYAFGFNTFDIIKASRLSSRRILVLAKRENTNANTDKEIKAVPKISFSNLLQLITMGAGAPSLGEFKRIDETGKMFFELDANNYVDSEGVSIQTKAKYFNEGWVESKDIEGAPGFWENLLSGGRLQTEWEEKRNARPGKK